MSDISHLKNKDGIIDISQLTSENIMDPGIYEALYKIADSITREQIKQKILLRAKELRMLLNVKPLMNTYEREFKEKIKKERQENEHALQEVDQFTNYTLDEGETDFGNMWCGSWIADDTGVYSVETSKPKEIVCYHPILPISRLQNMETGEEQIEIAWKRNGAWHRMKFPKEAIVSARTIVGLAKFGIAVNSETAKLLVKFLADVENGNEKYIPVGSSSSKLGWHGRDFLPYDCDIVFDGDVKHRDLFNSITERGSFSTWLECMRQVRASGAIEPRLALAASFASPLIRELDALPFIVDLNGETEGGKTVCLMVATSVWADPDKHVYMGDFQSTDTALETRSDMLNDLPLILDDTSKASKRIRENFENVVYDLCSGKGKSRSNKDLGTAREYTWSNTIICNGEKPLSYYVEQGGAINRIIEIPCHEHIFDDPRAVANTVKRNYGFAGRMFIEFLKERPRGEVESVRKEIEDQLTGFNTMQKQTLSLSILLVADKLATACIFKDDNSLKPDDVRELLTDRAEVSENMRCYAMLIDNLNVESQHFDIQFSCDQYGIIDRGVGVVYYYVSAFEKILEKENYSRRAFTRWAAKNNLLIYEKGRDTILKKVNGDVFRCICLKIIDDYETINDIKTEAVEDATLFDE